MDKQEFPEKASRRRLLGTIARYFGYLVLFVVALQLGQLWLQRDAVFGRAPAISSVDLNGSEVSLEDYRGKPLLLYFWASWCPVCRFEHGAITAIAEDYQVLGIALQSGSPLDVISHMQEHEASYRVINDPDGALGSLYGIRGVPTMFLLDAEGNIKTALSGFTSGLSLRVRMWLLSRQQG
jgi:thiol-disulfide isomerase/thioredoxin